MNPQKPLLIVFAGPNGAGKTTIRDHLFSDSEIPFINADEIAAKENIDAYEAAEVAAQQRTFLIEAGRPFIFETVLSDPVGAKVEFLANAMARGYHVEVHFIGLPSPAFSQARVVQRVMEGGHDVPDEKITARYPRILKNLERLIGRVSVLTIYDNSDAEVPYRILAYFSGDTLEKLSPNLPTWIAFLNLPGLQTSSTQFLP